MKIIRAEHLGMCFGVRDAIALALDQAEAGPLTILGDLVHNTTVLAALRGQGIAIAHEVGHVKTQTVMVTAHGASERRLANTRALGLDVVEATCPLVHVAHRAVMALVRDGYHPVIIGQRAHVEVRGLTEDLDDFDVVLDEARRAGARRTSAHRHCRANDAAASRGCSTWSRSFGGGFLNPTSASSTRSVSRRSSVRPPPSSWRAAVTSSSSSAARTATTRVSS